MKEKDWEILLTLHKEGTITKTAQELYLSQPALTYRIKQIEKEFDIQLIHRGSKGVIFTEEGEYLVHYAKEMLKTLRTLKDNLNNLEENIKGSLRIGVSSNYALYQLPTLLEGFILQNPNVEIHLTTGWSSKIISLMQSEEIHIAILRGDNNWPGKKFVIDEESIYITSKHPIKTEDLPKYNQIKYQTDIGLKNTFEEWWQSNFDVLPNVSMEVDRIETAKELVKKGLGYGVFPSISLKEEDSLYKQKIFINGKPILRKTNLLYREELLELKAVKAFVDYVKEFYDL